MSKQSRLSARERIRLERERQARQRRQRRALLITGAALALVVVAVVVAIVVPRGGQSGSQAIRPANYQGPFAPVTLGTGGVATMTRAGTASPVLVVYEDFQCPVCGQFERANGGMIQRLASQGRVKVVYHPFTIFVGRQPQQDNSVRAWAAARCVPAASWPLYHNLLYANQPPETQAGGFPVSLLLRLGQRIGLTGASFRQCVTSQRFASQAVPLSQGIIQGGITGTPTVTLNGKTVSSQVLVSSGTTLRQMILAAH